MSTSMDWLGTVSRGTCYFNMKHWLVVHNAMPFEFFEIGIGRLEGDYKNPYYWECQATRGFREMLIPGQLQSTVNEIVFSKSKVVSLKMVPTKVMQGVRIGLKIVIFTIQIIYTIFSLDCV